MGLALLAPAITLLVYDPQLDEEVALVTCTVAVAPAAKSPTAQFNVWFEIEHEPGPAYAGPIVQLMPIPPGSASASVTPMAAPLPEALPTVMV
jgi:hypothetical protein